MPDIYTASLQDLRALTAAGMLDQCVPIMRRLPAWVHRAHPEVAERNITDLAPSTKLLASVHWGVGLGREHLERVWPGFRAAYLREIEEELGRKHQVRPDDVVDHLRETAKVGPPIILCVCRRRECHRHALAGWLRDGWFSVEEWEAPAVPSPQGRLF